MRPAAKFLGNRDTVFVFYKIHGNQISIFGAKFHLRANALSFFQRHFLPNHIQSLGNFVIDAIFLLKSSMFITRPFSWTGSSVSYMGKPLVLPKIIGSIPFSNSFNPLDR